MTCGSCQYYQSDRGIWTCTGWTGDGSRGHCLVEPSPTLDRKSTRLNSSH